MLSVLAHATAWFWVDRGSTGLHYRSQQPIQTTKMDGRPVPHDSALVQYAAFEVDGKRVDAWRFPHASRWPGPDEKGDYYGLSLLCPEGYNLEDELGWIIPKEITSY